MSDVADRTHDHNTIPREKTISFLIFLFYSLLQIVCVIRHELWGDELHSWNISRVNNSIFSLLYNVRYEGHPPLWYILLHITSKIYNQPIAMQVLHLCIVLTIMWLICMKVHITVLHKIMFLSGYFILYEYGVISRNYAIALLIALSIVLLRHRNLKYDVLIYYFLLFLLSMTHVLGLFIALSLHFAFTIKHFGTWTKKLALLELLIGLLVLAPSLLFILPPGDSSLGMDFWRKQWNPEQLSIIVYAPLRSFLPIPAWWLHHSWNTQFLIQLFTTSLITKGVAIALSVSLPFLVYYILRPHRLGLNVFFINFFLTLLFAFVFPLSSMRYVGFLFIGFLIAVIISYHTIIMFKRRRYLLHLLLALQICATLPAVYKDLKFPFSQSRNVGSLVAGIPPSKLVTDYWTLNTVSASIKRAVYCVGYGAEREHVIWNSEMKQLMQRQNLYSSDITKRLEDLKSGELFLATYRTKEELIQADFRINESLYIEEMRAFAGSIERSSNLYLYRITSKKIII